MTARNEASTYWARWKFALLAVPLRECAHELGYNLIVHGSLQRDIDLVAIPWVEDAVTAETLIDNLLLTTRKHNGVGYFHPTQIAPTEKPHGRRSWVIFLLPDDLSVYLDISVTPRLENT